jgi:ketosteroid isomerase-like protein
MESTNVAVAREMFDAVGSGDYTTTHWAHPEIEVVFADGPDPGTSRGIAGMAESVREYLRAWDDWRTEPEDYRELDEERVLVLVRYSGRGKASGVPLARTKGAVVCHVREGKLTRIVRYWDRDRAFADLGLAPEAGSAGS